MTIVPFIVLFLLIAVTISLFGYRRYAKPANMLDQLATSTSVHVTVPDADELEAKAVTGLAKLIGSLGRLLPYAPRDVEVIRAQLSTAGFRSSYAPYTFLGIKLLSCSVLLLVALFVRGTMTDSPVNRLAIPLVAGMGGFLGPGLVLSRMTKKRQEKLRLSLPDVLDLLVISTEAGCALDKAMINVSREFTRFHPIISQELMQVNREMLAGGSRIEALRNFATRTGEEELKKLVAIMIQTDRFGTSVAEALRTQSEFMRVQRRQTAQEKAGKVGVKLVFPIFFFCMPSLVLIVAGPGFLELFKSLPSMVGAV